MKTRLKLLPVVCVMFLAACNFDSQNDPIIVPDVKKEFYVDIWEELLPQERRFWLLIETIEPENCLNASIYYDLDQLGNSITVSLDDIIVPSNCEAGQAPATADLDLGVLNTRTIDFKINLKNAVFNSGALQVNYDSYEVLMPAPEGIQFKHKKLMRVPNTAIWGYVSYTDNSQAAAAQDVVNSIKGISYTVDYPEGYYGYFSIGADSQITSVLGQPAGNRYKIFVFDYPGDKANLTNLLNDLRSMHPAPAFDIKLWNAQGESL